MRGGSESTRLFQQQALPGSVWVVVVWRPISVGLPGRSVTNGRRGLCGALQGAGRGCGMRGRDNPWLEGAPVSHSRMLGTVLGIRA